MIDYLTQLKLLLNTFLCSLTPFMIQRIIPFQVYCPSLYNRVFHGSLKRFTCKLLFVEAFVERHRMLYNFENATWENALSMEATLSRESEHSQEDHTSNQEMFTMGYRKQHFN